MGKSGPRPGQSAAVTATTTDIRELIAAARGVQGDIRRDLRELKDATIPAAVEQAVAAAVEQRITLMEAELVRAMADYRHQIVDAFEVLVTNLTGGVSAKKLVEMTSIEISGPELVDLLRELITSHRTEGDA